MLKWKDVKKNVKEKLGESFLELICFIFYEFLRFLLLVLGYDASVLLAVCFLLMALLEAVIEKCLLNRCLFKLAKSLKKPVKVFSVIIAGCSFPEIDSFTYVLRTLQKLLPCVLGNV